MASKQVVQILLEAENRTKSAFKGVEGEMKNMGKASQNVSEKFKSMRVGFQKTALVGAAAFGTLAVGMNSFINTASDAQEIQGKFDVVFKGMEESANSWAVSFAESTGRARQDIKMFSSGIADVLKPLGIATDTAFDMSTSITELALDVASFNNKQDADVIASFTAALTGERESLKSLGIVMQEADVKAEMLRQKKEGLVFETEKEAKAQATMALLYAGTADAQGDLARTAESYANKQKALQGAIKNTSEALGNVFLPIATEIVNKIEPIVKSFEKWIEQNPELAKQIIIVAGVISILAVAVGVLGMALPAVIVGFGILFSPITLAIGVIVALGIAFTVLYKKSTIVKKMADTFVKNLKLIGEILKFVISTVVSFGKDMWGTLMGVVSTIYNFGVMAVETITSFGSSFWSAGVSLITGFVDGVKSMFSNAISTVTDFGNNIISSIKGTLGIQSPSKVFEGFGIDTIDGYLKGIDESTPKVLTSMDNFVGDMKGAMTEYGDAVQSFNDDIQGAFKETEDKIDSLNAKMTDLLVSNAKENLGWKQDVAGAYVEQEQKVADLQAQISAESDAARRGELQRQLDEERRVFEAKRNLETVFGAEISEVRRRNGLTEFERVLEDINQKKMAQMEEFQNKKKSIENELKAEMEKMDILNAINNASLKEQDKFLAKSEQQTVDSVNRQITYYNQLADAVAMAQSGARSGFISAGAGVQARATAEITRPDAVITTGVESGTNITVNVSDNTLLDEDAGIKIGDQIIKRLELNMNI